MPRSKLDVENEKFLEGASEEERKAAQPENIAARALAHKAEEDVSEFWKTLARKCTFLAVEEMEILLPHIKISRVGRGIEFGGEKKVLDVLLAALEKGSHIIEELAPWSDDYEMKAKKTPGTPIAEYVFRERVKALAQELLTPIKEYDDDEGDDDDEEFDHIEGTRG